MQRWIILQVIVQLGRFIKLLREDWRVKLILTPIQLHIQKLVNYMANFFTVAKCEGFWLDIASRLTAKLFQVSRQLVECVHSVSMIIFEVDKYSHFL